MPLRPTWGVVLSIWMVIHEADGIFSIVVLRTSYNFYPSEKRTKDAERILIHESHVNVFLFLRGVRGSFSLNVYGSARREMMDFKGDLFGI